MRDASSVLDRAREEKASAGSAGCVSPSSNRDCKRSEASKADAVSHKRFVDAQDAATEIKTVLEQIDAARASHRPTSSSLSTTPSPCQRLAALGGGPRRRRESRRARLRAESSADTTDAIALVRLLHGDVLEDLDDDASQT